MPAGQLRIRQVDPLKRNGNCWDNETWDFWKPHLIRKYLQGNTKSTKRARDWLLTQTTSFQPSYYLLDKKLKEWTNGSPEHSAPAQLPALVHDHTDLSTTPSSHTQSNSVNGTPSAENVDRLITLEDSEDPLPDLSSRTCSPTSLATVRSNPGNPGLDSETSSVSSNEYSNQSYHDAYENREDVELADQAHSHSQPIFSSKRAAVSSVSLQHDLKRHCSGVKTTILKPAGIDAHATTGPGGLHFADPLSVTEATDDGTIVICDPEDRMPGETCMLSPHDSPPSIQEDDIGLQIGRVMEALRVVSIEIDQGQINGLLVSDRSVPSLTKQQMHKIFMCAEILYSCQMADETFVLYALLCYAQYREDRPVHDIFLRCRRAGSCPEDLRLSCWLITRKLEADGMVMPTSFKYLLYTALCVNSTLLGERYDSLVYLGQARDLCGFSTQPFILWLKIHYAKAATSHLWSPSSRRSADMGTPVLATVQSHGAVGIPNPTQGRFKHEWLTMIYHAVNVISEIEDPKAPRSTDPESSAASSCPALNEHCCRVDLYCVLHFRWRAEFEDICTGVASIIGMSVDEMLTLLVSLLATGWSIDGGDPDAMATPVLTNTRLPHIPMKAYLLSNIQALTKLSGYQFVNMLLDQARSLSRPYATWLTGDLCHCHWRSSVPDVIAARSAKVPTYQQSRRGSTSPFATVLTSFSLASFQRLAARIHEAATLERLQHSIPGATTLYAHFMNSLSSGLSHMSLYDEERVSIISQFSEGVW